MDRRQFLQGGGAFAASCIASRGASASSPRNCVVLRLGFTGTRVANIGSGAVALAKRVEETCGGRVLIDLYPAAEAGGESEAMQDMQSGALDMVYASSAAYVQANPALGIFDIPFLFHDVGHARAVLDGPIGQNALGLMEGGGVVGLAWGENGLRHLTTATTPVRAAADLQGLKIRVPQSPVMVAGFLAMGAQAKPLPFPDLYAALASGEFQAQENPLMTIRDTHLDRVQRYLCLTGHVYSPSMFMIGKHAYARLTPSDAQALRAAAAAGAQASRATADASETSIIAQLRERGMTIVEDIDRDSFIAALAGAQKDFQQRFGVAQIAAIQQAGR